MAGRTPLLKKIIIPEGRGGGSSSLCPTLQCQARCPACSGHSQGFGRSSSDRGLPFSLVPSPDIRKGGHSLAEALSFLPLTFVPKGQSHSK